MKEVFLVTGADGFIGSHFVEHAILNTDADIVCLCSWTKGGYGERISRSPRVFSEVGGRIKILTHDLSVPFSEIMKRDLVGMGITDVINFASDSHVDRSIEHPVAFIQNNVSVCLNMLELSRGLDLRSFVQISTDEVYGPASAGHNHSEWEAIIPSNPYSASKAAQEAIAISYWRTYGVPVVITNTMNNIGERQSGEKFLPLIIRSVLNGDVVPIHAIDGVCGSRYYLHARNHADAVLHVVQKTPVPQYKTPGRTPPYASVPSRFHVVGEIELSNLELAEFVAEVLGKDLSYDLIDGHSARPGHDLRYALSGMKLERAGWMAPVPLLPSIKKTVQWYVKNPEWLVHAS